MSTRQEPLPGTKFSEEEFDLQEAKKSAKDGPVFLTDGDHKTHVFLSIESYKKISSEGLSLFDVLYDQRLADTDPDFEFPRIDSEFRPFEFD